MRVRSGQSGKVAIMTERPPRPPTPVTGVFWAVSTRDGEARARSGSPYARLRELGTDARGQQLFEIQFLDGEWMLAVESDLQPVGGRRPERFSS